MNQSILQPRQQLGLQRMRLVIQGQETNLTSCCMLDRLICFCTDQEAFVQLTCNVFLTQVTPSSTTEAGSCRWYRVQPDAAPTGFVPAPGRITSSWCKLPRAASLAGGKTDNCLFVFFWQGGLHAVHLTVYWYSIYLFVFWNSGIRRCSGDSWSRNEHWQWNWGWWNTGDTF